MNKITQIFLLFAVLGLVLTKGGYSARQFNPETNVIDKMALQALVEKLAESELELTDIIKCNTQVVSGTKYLLTIVTEIFEQKVEYDAIVYVVPWENYAEVLDIQLVENQRLTQQIDGGSTNFNWNDNSDENMDVTKQLIIEMISQKLQELDQNTNFRVVDATSQVVSGIKYVLDITNGDNDFQVSVLSQPWKNILKILGFEQVEKTQQNTLQAGELIDLDWNQNQVIDAAIKNQIKKLISANLYEQGISTNEFTIVSSKYQVVNGIKLVLEVEAENKTFEIVLLSQPWLNNLEVVSCQELYFASTEEKLENLSNLRKQFKQPQVSAGFEKAPEKIKALEIEPIPVGTFTSVSYNSIDSEIKELIMSALATKLESTGITVVSAEQQVVNGIIYKLVLNYEGEQYEATIHVYPYKSTSSLIHFAQI